MRQRAHQVPDAAYEAGVRYVEAARSYGLAEEFVVSWFATRNDPVGDVVVGSKWGGPVSDPLGDAGDRRAPGSRRSEGTRGASR
jgi:aryl-alcohol dehydrogenase-like predicted oxidoreductase